MKNELETMVMSIADLAMLISGVDIAQRGEPDNAERSALAAEVLCLFAKRTGQLHSGDPAETIMVDLLTDMMHLCDSVGIAFERVLAVSSIHHESERDC
ncbi:MULTISPECIES: hypothetical protein [Edwardsiella]|uniref:hypothetical protein n=1 Tax=Edwardsiella TaxID=635 RepID=UPI000D513838|nr:hypothetical protein [Edwardsiella piscicida]UCQ13088.1 hypothetical protein DCF76_16880 [Edwardsiella tarda]UJT80886.1 hypothetical protein L1P06_18475 [Edwardsiella piscicida]